MKKEKSNFLGMYLIAASSDTRTKLVKNIRYDWKSIIWSCAIKYIPKILRFHDSYGKDGTTMYIGIKDGVGPQFLRGCLERVFWWSVNYWGVGEVGKVFVQDVEGSREYPIRRS